MDPIMTWIPFGLCAVSIILLIVLIFLNASNRRAIREMEEDLRGKFHSNREEAARLSSDLREEVARTQKSSMEATLSTVGELGKVQRDKLESVETRIRELTGSNETRIERLRNTLEAQMASLQRGNELKLDQMRQVVEEKLENTLETRLARSFRIVSERLEAVQRGLGEMQSLAAGVGDLKRVLTNVKARGTWGEVQLGAILEQILTPDQYAKNVRTRKGTRETVEYAVRLPGHGRRPEAAVWLPIDSKFPQEDYLRLVSAAEAADADGVEKATEALVRGVRGSARQIGEKYLDPPGTTDFAIMFLPTEGLYAEVLRQSGLVEALQQDFRVVVAGPTTLAAILSSLRMGFRTLAIEKRSSEVWKVLAAVKTEFGRFGETLGRLKSQLDAASNTIDQTGVRARAMRRKLRQVEELPGDAAEDLLDLSE
ncbi:MAG: DNA recombination protein RmuC [Deltaproteobacteria bacterium]|nr:DNA recombination protein RmuC [Deltaproteobacteria bacterium]MBW2047449.1 DNA recombination protein RmuC [Deltaproteobacteria bacterium]MBW2112044.1 DNA recombination protein RmuC [Deltaproteobacteria bacterium]MBW2353417.1 DNA recombination protein RmuC [Deltaproteobacteria bacterium]HDZ90404.1 DNA recombination protein RmuC [Deltaproteobacteria bacterium]